MRAFPGLEVELSTSPRWTKDPDLIVLCGRNDLLETKHNFKESRKHVYKQWNKPLICTWGTKYLMPDTDVPELRLEVLNDIVWGINMLEGGDNDAWLNVPQGDIDNCKQFGWDIETTGLNPHDKNEKILTSVVTDCYHWTEDDSVLKDPTKTVIGHNLKFDYNWYEKRRFRVKAKPFSTDVAAFLLDDNATDNTLEYHTTRINQMTNHKTLDRKNMGQYKKSEVLAYNKDDAVAGFHLWSSMRDRMHDQGLLPLFNLIMDSLPVFSKLEVRGIQLDQPWTMRVSKKVQAELAEATAAIPVDNPNSGQQVAKLLYETLGLPVIKKTDGGDPATDATTLKLLLLRDLKKCQTDMIQCVLNYRKVDKLWSGYFKKYPKLVQHDGRIHGSYALAKGEDGGAGTGRTSCRNPNLQNQPNRRDVRGCFKATFGHRWGDADYCGLEMAIAADFANEVKMIEALKAGHDFHTATMARMYNEDYDEINNILTTRGEAFELWKKRRVATKRVNFGILYGISAKRLRIMLLLEGINMSHEECQDLIDQWLHTNASLNKWLRSTEAEARDHGRVTAPTGGVRRLPGANRHDYVGGRQLRRATNYPIQHTASVLLVTAMVLLDEWFEKEGDMHLLMNVHDQVAFEFKGDDRYVAETVKQIMEVEAPKDFARRFGYEFKVPFRVDLNIADRWT
jgi:DNA polymerase-1